ncbi:MAG: DNA methylase [Bacteroidales bacterium]|nr:DNA methylase [Bacteroidales bacterium]
MQKTYIAIDLKSFYASVECVERGLDPLTTNLVVADSSRTEKTICLAVSPSLKSYGIPGRARLFEVVQKVKSINLSRQYSAPGRAFRDSSFDNTLVQSDPSLRLDYIVAPPQMAHYMDVSGKIYAVYLKYVSPEDIHVYSIDEVFVDATDYLKTYSCTAHELAMRMIKDVLSTTGITATAGIGTNLYLAKVAMDIEAKHQKADADGVRIAELDEMSYRQKLWSHTPLRDFWRVGRGIASKLESVGIHTMGDIALCSTRPDWEAYLYKVFGVNAELLIDHAWGWEPCTIKDIKAYQPESNSISSGQVLSCAYDKTKARIVIMEMADSLSMDLFRKGLVTDQLVLYVGYDGDSLSKFTGEMAVDYYGRKVPKPAHGSINLSFPTSSTSEIVRAASELFDRIVDGNLSVRRLNLTAAHVISEKEADSMPCLDLFGERQDNEKERKRQEAILAIRNKFGKNALLKGLDFEDGATSRERNAQIGGHKA